MTRYAVAHVSRHTRSSGAAGSGYPAGLRSRRLKRPPRPPAHTRSGKPRPSSATNFVGVLAMLIATAIVAHAAAALAQPRVAASDGSSPPAALGVNTTPTPTLAPTPTAVTCCFCPNPGGREDCANPVDGGCLEGCILLPNARCVNSGTSLANCETYEPTPTPPPPCPGDCSGSSTVGEADLLTAVALIFDAQFPITCALTVFDWDGNGQVSAAELVGVVQSAIFGCGAD